MGPERRPRRHRRRRNAAVRRVACFSMCNTETAPPLSPPSRGRTALWELKVEVPILDAAANVGPLASRTSMVLPLEGGDRGGAVSTRSLIALGAHPSAHATRSHLSSLLFNVATRLERGRAACAIESKPRLQHLSPAAKCVATTPQRVHEMQHRDSGLHRASRPLSRASSSLRGRRNSASRRADER
jgi:hypothetical protein